MKKLLIPLISIIGVFLFVHSSKALEFNADYLISDFHFSQNDSMTAYDIKSFIEQFNTPLRLYMESNPLTGQKEWSWEIIKNAADTYQINPQVLLTMLQKEQSLLLGSEYKLAYRLNWAMGYGVCDSCSPYDPRLAAYKGFTQQVNQAARRMRQCLDEPAKFRVSAQNTYNIDGQNIKPLNQATACLYNYTPHLAGNRNFVTIWDRWFGRSYPDNTLIKAKNQSRIYKLENGSKRLITTPGLLADYIGQYPLIDIDEWELNQYPDGRPIEYSLYSLLGVPQNGIYLLAENNQIRRISSAKVFKELGFSIEEIEKVQFSDLETYNIGNEITDEDIYPLGLIAQNSVSGDMYYLYQNKRHPILDPNLLKSRLRYRQTIQKTPEELAAYELAENILYPDGTLLKESNGPFVYLIQNGQKRHIANEYTFNRLNYKWSDILDTNFLVLQNYPDGETIDYESIDEAISQINEEEINNLN